VEEAAITWKGKEKSTQDWTNLADNNSFGLPFAKEYRKKEDPTTILSLTMTNPDFNPVEFITEIGMKNCTQVTWKAQEEENFFTVL